MELVFPFLPLFMAGEQACRASDLVFTVFLNEQSEILAALLELYFPHGAKVIDLTYGSGALWRNFQNLKSFRKYHVTACDAKPSEASTGVNVKKKNLLTDEYSELGLHDVAIFDPPYLIHRNSFDYFAKIDPKNGSLVPSECQSSHSWSALDLEKFTSNQSLEVFNYRVECLRKKAPSILKPDGLLFVKIMDPRNDGHLITHHLTIANILEDVFELIDIGVYIRMGATTWKIKGHLHNLHGYWMIFKLR